MVVRVRGREGILTGATVTAKLRCGGGNNNDKKREKYTGDKQHRWAAVSSSNSLG